MKLVGLHSTFQMQLAGYQFARLPDDAFDANWLLVHCSVTHNGRSWEFTDPCLLTWEVVAIAEYLSAAALGTADPAGLSFVEPNLGFAYASNGVLRVQLELEARPPWVARRFAGEGDYYIDFQPSTSELQAAAASLRNQSAAYPRRGQA